MRMIVDSARLETQTHMSKEQPVDVIEDGG